MFVLDLDYMYFNNRKKSILNLLIDYKNLSLKDFENILGIKERTMYKELNKLNLILYSFKLKGIGSNRDSIFYLKDSIDEISNLINDEKLYIYSQKERIDITIFEIIFLNKKLSLEYFTKKFRISRNTFFNDLKLIKVISGKNELKIFITPKKGYFFEGCEFSKRNFLLNFITNYSNLLGNYIEDNFQKKIDKLFFEFEKELNKYFIKIDSKFLKKAVAILMLYYKSNYSIKIDEETKELNELTIVYRKLVIFQKFFSSYFGFEFNNDERHYLTIIIFSFVKRLSSIEDLFWYINELKTPILNSMKKFEAKTHLFFEEENKENLIMSLLNYLIPLYQRRKNKIILSSNLEINLIKNWNKYYDLVIESIIDIEKALEIKFIKSELNAIVCFFLAWMFKSKISVFEFDVVIIDEGPNYFTEFLKTQIELFESSCRVIKTFSNYENNLDNLYYDFIFSTKNIENKRINFLKISNQLNDLDIKNIKKLINTKREVNKNSELPGLRNYINKENIKIYENGYDWKEALSLSIEAIIKNKKDHSEYLKTVINDIEKRKIYTVNFPEIIILQLKPIIKKASTKMSLNIFKDPIPFLMDDKVYNIKLILFIIVNPTLNHLRALEEFYSIIKDEKKKEKLLDAKSAKEVMDLIS